VDERLSATTSTTGTISTAATEGEGEGDPERLQRRSLRVLLASRLLSVRASPRA
jgi:hypothetical protein